jgi:hypothetical protein
MRTLVLAAALAAGLGLAGGALVLAPAPAEAQAGQSLAAGALTGDWAGGYVSSDGADVNTFTVKMRQMGGSVSGTIYEVNTFGDTSRALFLTSTFTGAVTGRQVRFTKTYDGSGGQSHAVVYTGTLEPNGRRIRGTFAAGAAGGTFEMVRN